MERLAGTFQDRLVTEMRHSAAAAIAEAQHVLDRFLPFLNARFRVAATQSGPAYCAPDSALDMVAVVAFRQPRTAVHDNTVKYLLPARCARPSPNSPAIPTRSASFLVASQGCFASVLKLTASTCSLAYLQHQAPVGRSKHQSPLARY